VFGTIKRPAVPISIVLIVAATLYAIHDDKVANLLIGAAMVSSTLAGISMLMDRRLGDAYLTGAVGQLRALLREALADKGVSRD